MNTLNEKMNSDALLNQPSEITSQLSRQEYKDSTLEQAIAAGCDLVQFKYDGWWCHNRWRDREVQNFSQTGRHFETISAPWDDDADLISEAMRGTQWSQDVNRKGFYYVFDIWSYRGKDLRRETYATRMNYLRTLFATCPVNPGKFKIVQTYNIHYAKQLWDKYITLGAFEGLVYRKSSDVVGAPVYREKLIITETLRLHRFTAGQGRHEGRLGALIGITDKGVEVAVGGGLSDTDRDDIWNHPEKYLGRYFDVEARARFESGSLRHPNFLRWRDDK